MASLQTKEETLIMIIRNSPMRYICPPCFEFFPREDLLNRHMYERSDDTHAGLRAGLRKRDSTQTDAEKFLIYYRQSVNTSVAAENIPPAPDCFAVDFVVEHYHSFPRTMASLQRRVETLKKIIQVSPIDFVCPICLRGFPRPALLYDHFRKQGEDAHAPPAKKTAKEQWEMEMHAGLAKRTSRKQWDMEKFLTCYRQSVRTSMAVEGIPPNSHCFEVNFVIEHYSENTGSQH
ncbi:hypothetical protein ASPBRDRAFT_48967 [Aspergillus brasiliensis CBS 101740]|uniref:C2H2-type domain-containing protein n=1 Tax=Aspergillus brasiliensis (strain CBS 101740 / IMI 381727 / IBT 21946) TaxID=767769 RepID=A0A1L9U3V1_ASPBC|nr:hypothetical protein ASPBRDRAFT_48967 [Aspergillus brasiliensis CBS 101740]